LPTNFNVFGNITVGNGSAVSSLTSAINIKQTQQATAGGVCWEKSNAANYYCQFLGGSNELVFSNGADMVSIGSSGNLQVYLGNITMNGYSIKNNTGLEVPLGTPGMTCQPVFTGAGTVAGLCFAGSGTRGLNLTNVNGATVSFTNIETFNDTRKMSNGTECNCGVVDDVTYGALVACKC
jgi:hypothetical protein